MAEIINLRRARKMKKRDDAARQADANRLAFGRSKHDRDLARQEKTLAERKLDGHRLDTSDDKPSDDKPSNDEP